MPSFPNQSHNHITHRRLLIELIKQRGQAHRRRHNAVIMTVLNYQQCGNIQIPELKRNGRCPCRIKLLPTRAYLPQHRPSRKPPT